MVNCKLYTIATARNFPGIEMVFPRSKLHNRLGIHTLALILYRPVKRMASVPCRGKFLGMLGNQLGIEYPEGKLKYL